MNKPTIEEQSNKEFEEREKSYNKLDNIVRDIMEHGGSNVLGIMQTVADALQYYSKGTVRVEYKIKEVNKNETD